MSEDKCSECIYKAEGPYPKVQVKERNAAYAREMLSNMADIASEISDVSRYFYIAVMTAPKYGEISECFHNISIVEIRGAGEAARCRPQTLVRKEREEALVVAFVCRLSSGAEGYDSRIG